MNCGAIAETLLDSELFGHTRGSFTGAVARSPRALRAGAATGRSSSTRSARRRRRCRSSCCACSRSPKSARSAPRASSTSPPGSSPPATSISSAEVAAGRFRQDLFYRLERGGDRDAAAARAARRHPAAHRALPRSRLHARRAGASTSPRRRIDALSGYGWPGNVRELENTVERLVLFSRASVIEVGDLPQAIRSRGPGSRPACSPICRRSTSSNAAT